MIHKALFIGGPYDGERRPVAGEKVKVPIEVTGNSVLLYPDESYFVYEHGSLGFVEDNYHVEFEFYKPLGVSLIDAVAQIMANYRPEKPNEDETPDRPDGECEAG